MTLVENLRRYVGEQVPPEVHSQTWESERLELLETVQVRMPVHLCSRCGWPRPGRACPRREGCRPALSSLSCWQHLQEDRDGLHGTAELLRVRVQSLTHILSMQEEELARKVGPSPVPP